VIVLRRGALWLVALAALAASPCHASTPGARCHSPFGALVPDEATARKIAVAIIGAHQSRTQARTYLLKVGRDEDGNWLAYQAIPDQRSKTGRMVVTEGGGGFEMIIDQCTAQVSQFYRAK